MKSISPSPRAAAIANKNRPIGVGGCLVIAGCLLGMLILLPVVGYFMWSRAAEKRIEGQLAELQAAEQPTTPEELEAYYEYPPEHEDVTPLILPAIQRLDTPEFEIASQRLPLVGSSEKEVPPPDQLWEDREAVRDLLNKYSEALRRLHEAADKGGAARFPVRFEDGFLMLMEHAQQLRAAAQLLALEAHVRAHERDAHGAAESIRVLLSLARSIEREPVIISQLVGWACSGIARRVILQLLPQVDFSDEDLAMLQRQLRRERVADGLRHSLIGERVFGIDAMRHPEKLRDFDDGSEMPKLVTSTNAAMELYLNTLARLIDATEQPWPEAQRLAAQAAQDVEVTAGGSPLNQIRYIMCHLLLPSEALIEAGARTDAMIRVVDTAIGVERYRREHDQPPQEIKALVPKYLPAVPSDPFDGQPLRYILEDYEIVIYSIGQDKVDNHGQGDFGGNPDIVVRLPR